MTTLTVEQSLAVGYSTTNKLEHKH